MSKNIFSNLKNDLSSGVVVFLVAVPLCLGIALASGAPLFSGIITGIIGGIVVGMLSGSTKSVSGPAAGLTVIVLSSVETLGSFQAFLLAVVLAGVIQLILGFARAGIISHYFPTSVIKGMLAAIGLILILKQIPHAVGYDADYEGDMAFWQLDGANTFSSIANAFGYLHIGAILIAAISFAIILFWETKFMKKFDFTKVIPGALVAVLASILINLAFPLFAPELYIGEIHRVNIPVINGVSELPKLLTFPDFSAIMNKEVFAVAITIAIIASIETLLSVEATDKLDPNRTITPTNRELKAQGVGNIISGLLGGLPMTSVIVRSSANIESGAKTKMSAIFHGILLLIAAVIIPQVLNLIPLAALAAILILVGYKLVRVSIIKQMFKLGWGQFIPFAVTITAILFTDLLVGICIGMAVAIFFILRRNYKTPYFLKSEENGSVMKYDIKLPEEVSFLNKGRVLLALRSIPEDSQVVIDGSGSRNIDHDVLEVINDFQSNAKSKNIDVQLKNITLHLN